MKREAINKQIEELEAKLAELKAQVNKPETDEWPKVGSDYFRITSIAELDTPTFDNDDLDNRAKSIGNMFRTREQAERRIEQLKLIQELREFGGDEGEYHIWYNLTEWDWGCGYSGLVQFPSEEKAEEAIKHFGDRLNILLPTNKNQ